MVYTEVLPALSRVTKVLNTLPLLFYNFDNRHESRNISQACYVLPFEICLLMCSSSHTSALTINTRVYPAQLEGGVISFKRAS